MEKSVDSHSSDISLKLLCIFCAKDHVSIGLDAYNVSTQQQCHICGCNFSIGSASLGVATLESAEYYTGICNAILVEPHFLQYFLNA